MQQSLVLFNNHIYVLKSINTDNKIYLPTHYQNVTAYDKDGYILPYKIKKPLALCTVLDKKGNKYEGELLQETDKNVHIKTNIDTQQIIAYSSYDIKQSNVTELISDKLQMATYESNIDCKFNVQIVLQDEDKANVSNTVTFYISEDNITSENTSYMVYINPNLTTDSYSRTRSLVPTLSLRATSDYSDNDSSTNLSNLASIGLQELFIGEQSLQIKQYDIVYGKYHVLSKQQDNIFLYFKDLPLPYNNIQVFNKQLLLLTQGLIVREHNVATINSGSNASTNILFIDNSSSAYDNKTGEYTYHIDIKITRLSDQHDVYYLVSKAEGIVKYSKPQHITMMAGNYLLQLDQSNDYRIKQDVIITN